MICIFMGWYNYVGIFVILQFFFYDKYYFNLLEIKDLNYFGDYLDMEMKEYFY